MKTFTTWMEELGGQYDDLLSDYGLSDDEIIEARNILDDAGEIALEDWLQNMKKGLSYANVRAIVRTLKSSKDHQDGFADEMKHDWPGRGY